MVENGTATFVGPDDYQDGIDGVSCAGASVNFIVTGGGDFNARLTWLNLHRLRVLRFAEHCLLVVAATAGRVSDEHGAIDMGGLQLRLVISFSMAAVNGRINGLPGKLDGVLFHCRPIGFPLADWP